MIGDASYGQVSLFFSLIGLLNASILWPLVLALYLTGAETFNWEQLPWIALLAASSLSLGTPSPCPQLDTWQVLNGDSSSCLHVSFQEPIYWATLGLPLHTISLSPSA